MSVNLRRCTNRTLPGLFAALVALAAPYAAFASGDYFRSSPQLPKYQQECGTCHTAFPPRMLHAASWQRLTSNLKNHFGTDASLDPASQKQIADWLGANAASKRMSGEPPEDRITRSTWFTMEHHDMSAATWKLPAVKSAANCSACHPGANQGEFHEHDVKIPR